MAKAATNTPKRCVMYLRCSTDDQSYGDYTTIDTQRAINQERIDALGGVLVGEYNDEGRTGMNFKRPDWKRLLADARERKFDAVIVTYMSRLARGEMFHVAEYLLGEEKVKIELVRENFTPDMAGQMAKGMKVVFDGAYTRQVSDWTKTAMQRRVQNGWSTGGIPPYGYTSEPVPGMTPTLLPGGKVKPPPRQRIPHPEQRAHVLRAFELFSLTDNIGEVQRYLRQVAPERQWAIDRVKALLQNEVYRGVARFGQTINPAAHEAIISEQLWDTVQSLLGARDERTATAEVGHSDRTDPFTYYLRGKITCASCGGRMTPSWHHGATTVTRYYECVRPAKRGTPCEIKRVNARTVHEAIVEELARCAKHPTRLTLLLREAIKQLPASDELQNEVKRLHRNKREAERKIRANQAALETAGVKGATLTSLVGRIGELEAHIAEIERELGQLQGQLAESHGTRPDVSSLCSLWGDFTSCWNYFTEEERAEVAGLLVERVEMVTKEKGTLHVFMQSPPQETWAKMPYWVRG